MTTRAEKRKAALALRDIIRAARRYIEAESALENKLRLQRLGNKEKQQAGDTSGE